MADPSPSETRAVARLPGVDLLIEHRSAGAGAPEELHITLRSQAVGPDAFGQFVGMMNPMLAWMTFAQAVWAPWMALADPARWLDPARPPEGPRR